MKIGRSIGAVVAGYLVFATSAVVLFQLTGVDPHAPAPPMFIILSTLYGMFLAGLGGSVAAFFAGRRQRTRDSVTHSSWDRSEEPDRERCGHALKDLIDVIR